MAEPVGAIGAFEWMARENYAGARTLARIPYLGFEFRVVRLRTGGKPWRKYLTLLYGDMPVTDGVDQETDAVKYAHKMESALASTYPDAEPLRARLEELTAGFNYWRDPLRSEPHR